MQINIKKILLFLLAFGSLCVVLVFWAMHAMHVENRKTGGFLRSYCNNDIFELPPYHFQFVAATQASCEIYSRDLYSKRSLDYEAFYKDAVKTSYCVQNTSFKLPTSQVFFCTNAEVIKKLIAEFPFLDTLWTNPSFRVEKQNNNTLSIFGDLGVVICDKNDFCSLIRYNLFEEVEGDCYLENKFSIIFPLRIK